MSLVLKFEDPASSEELGVFYINAVENYSKDVRGAVSKHPLDSGVSIGDHFTSENMTFTIKGVITSADISVGLDGVYRTFSPTSDNNLQGPPTPLTVDNGDSVLTKYTPNVIGQFLSPLEPSVSGDEGEVVEFGTSFQDFIEKMMLDVIYNPQNQMYRNSLTPATLYEMEGSVQARSYANLVVTSFKVNETPDTGTGCHFDITLEQARFVDIQRGQLPDDVSEEVERQAKAAENMGGADSAVQDTEDEFVGPIKPKSNLLTGGQAVIDFAGGLIGGG